MSAYFYLVSQLPMLRIGEEPPFSSAEFRQKCEGVLTEDELASLDALLAGEPAENSFVQEFEAREIQMKNVAGKIRAQAWGPDAHFTERSFNGYDVDFAKKINEALSRTSPLEKEEEIDKARFNLADELAGVGEPTVAFIYAFAVKLAICERWAKLSNEAGAAELLNAINENDPDYKRERPEA
ncbi:MAG: DUF2764 domain-containing protein [Fibrobacteraceae bacterium]|nr:DUF2764 domain-containing protein [Fibrobacteraceae bacterium]